MGRINYERVAVVPYGERQLKLDRMRQLLTRLGASGGGMGSPDAGLRIIHIAGTKGKGSTAAMIAAVLTASGHRTGVYSSPHLERIEERFTIDGQPIGEEELVDLVARLRVVVETIDAEVPAADAPTFFDITTALALVYFADRECNAVVLEVGLGGRLDSTNVCLPVVSVITSISFDHTKQLGNTLAAIAGEKAGIIKPGVPVVSGVRPAEPREVIAEIARERGCRLIEPDIEAARDFQVGLLGAHQRANAAVAVAVIDELRDQGWAIPDEAVRQGLAAARLPARVEWLASDGADRPAVIVDTAHNAASAEALAVVLREIEIQGTRTLILAVSRDKDLRAILSALAPEFDRVIATRFVENPRAVAPGRLAKGWRAAKPQAVVLQAEEPLAAWRLALEVTPSDGLIVIAGSFFIAAELRAEVRRLMAVTPQR